MPEIIKMINAPYIFLQNDPFIILKFLGVFLVASFLFFVFLSCFKTFLLILKTFFLGLK